MRGVGKIEKEGGIGRPRKYGTAAAFRRAVEGYFRSITRTVNVKDTDTGLALLNDDLEPVRVPEYIVPPSFTDMLLWLGISKKTWCNYANGDNADIAWVCDRAKARIEAYLERELMTRQKGVQGIIFNLSSNYAWKEKREIEVGTETRKALAAGGMTMEEKMELIRAAAAEAGEDGQDED